MRHSERAARLPYREDQAGCTAGLNFLSRGLEEVFCAYGVRRLRILWSVLMPNGRGSSTPAAVFSSGCDRAWKFCKSLFVKIVADVPRRNATVKIAAFYAALPWQRQPAGFPTRPQMGSSRSASTLTAAARLIKSSLNSTVDMP